MFRKKIDVPGPSPSQIHTKLEPYNFTFQSEIISTAYEPRFEIFGFGSSDGHLIIGNRFKKIFLSQTSIEYPLLELFPCTNSTAFLSVYSKFLLNKHPMRNATDGKGSNSKNTLKYYKPGDAISVLSVWLFQEDHIILRGASVPYDITACALSPSSPNYALISTTEGSIYGYSLEQMKITNLYLNQFEGHPITSLYSPYDSTYFVCHEKVDVIDIESMELDTAGEVKIRNLDCIGSTQAAISVETGDALLLKNFKVSKTHKPEEGETIIDTYLITESKWVVVVRSSKGETVYVDEKPLFTLNFENDDHEILAMGAIRIYKDPFSRGDIHDAFFVTNKLNLRSLGEPEKVINLFPQFTPAEYIFGDESELVLFGPQHDGNRAVSLLAGGDLQTIGEYKIIKPIAMKNRTLICLTGEAEVSVLDISGRLFLPMVVMNDTKFSATSESKTMAGVMDDAKGVLCCNESDPGWTFQYSLPKVPPKSLMWSVASDNTSVFITHDFKLSTDKAKEPVHLKPKESNILLTVIDNDGCESQDGNWILLVTSKSAKIKDLNLKTARKFKPKYKIIEATVAKWGGLILVTEGNILYMTLPDVEDDPVQRIMLSKEQTAHIIPHFGVMTFNPTIVYSNKGAFKVKNFIDYDKPPVGASLMKRVFGPQRMKPMTVSEVDEAFKCNQRRPQPKAASAASNLSEVSSAMQQLIAEAQLRSEKLSEMEDKSRLIADHARDFAEAARKLKNSI